MSHTLAFLGANCCFSLSAEGVRVGDEGDREYSFNLITFLQLLSSTRLVPEEPNSAGHRMDPSILTSLGSGGCDFCPPPQQLVKFLARSPLNMEPTFL